MLSFLVIWQSINLARLLKIAEWFFFPESSEQLLLFIIDSEFYVKKSPLLETLMTDSLCLGDTSSEGFRKNRSLRGNQGRREVSLNKQGLFFLEGWRKASLQHHSRYFHLGVQRGASPILGQRPGCGFVVPQAWSLFEFRINLSVLFLICFLSLLSSGRFYFSFWI